jgi:hypothetical protein
LITHVRRDDSRILNLVRAGAGVADIGWPEMYAALDDSSTMPVMPSGRRDDYALAAGADAGLAHKAGRGSDRQVRRVYQLECGSLRNIRCG